MGLFVAFILGLVFFMVASPDKLYDKDYYAKGERYSELRELESQGKGIDIKLTRNHLIIDIKRQGKIDKIRLIQIGGKQRQVIIKGDSNLVEIHFNIDVNAEAGRWDVEVYGKRNGTDFLRKKKTTVP